MRREGTAIEGYCGHFADTSSGLLFEFWKDEGEFGVRVSLLCDSVRKVKPQRFIYSRRCTLSLSFFFLFGEA